jgi:hypothetical protein
MSTSHMPHASLAHHGIHLVARSEKKAVSLLLCPNVAYKVAAAGVALLLIMTVC